MSYQLVCISGNAIPGALPINQNIEIGRDPHCDIRIADDVCSRFHAQVSLIDKQVTIRDNNSSNGTFVDGKKIEEVQLEHNQQFSCGTCTFVIINNKAQSQQTRIISDAGKTVAVTHSVDSQMWDPKSDPKQLVLIHHVCRELAAQAQAQRAATLLQAAEKICHADQIAFIARGARLEGNMSERLCQRLVGGSEARLFILGKDLHGQTIADEAIGSACSIPLNDSNFIIVARSIDKDPFTQQHLQLLATLGAESSIYFPNVSDELEEHIIGDSAIIQKLRQRIKKLAHSDSTILVTGPSGSGKELVAQNLHFLSGRHLGPFVAVNCGAISDNLFEAELFGHEKGAFTGAAQKRIGRFQAADGGTIFLDEIGELSLDMQVKLLRVLQERKVTPVGSNEEIPINVRIIAATNRDLQNEVHSGRFREDLYYRIDVLRLHTPPLAERKEDIQQLSLALLGRLANDAGRPCPELSAAASNKLSQATWPGNVRQLENILRRALAMADQRIDADDIELDAPLTKTADPDHFPTLAELEARHVKAALERCNGNKSEAARLLGVSRPTIHKKIGDYGLE